MSREAAFTILNGSMRSVIKIKEESFAFLIKMQQRNEKCQLLDTTSSND